MKNLTFKTNIKCTGCLAKAAPFLNRAAGKDNWEVDLQNPERILTVTGTDTDSAAVQSAVKEAGYTAEPAG